MKKCTKCGLEKETSEFYTKRADCKSCSKARTAKHNSSPAYVGRYNERARLCNNRSAMALPDESDWEDCCSV